MTLHLRAAVQATNLIARALLAALRLAPMPPSEPPRPHDAFKAIRDADPLGWHCDSCELAAQLAADREQAHPHDWQKWERQMPLTAHDLAWQMEADA